MGFLARIFRGSARRNLHLLLQVPAVVHRKTDIYQFTLVYDVVRKTSIDLEGSWLPLECLFELGKEPPSNICRDMQVVIEHQYAVPTCGQYAPVPHFGERLKVGEHNGEAVALAG